MGGDSDQAEGFNARLTDYGDREFSIFLRRVFLKSMGYGDDALSRPIIGITNTYSGYNSCHGRVPQIVDAVKRGVLLAGGLPVEFPTMSIHESFCYPTSMYLRNLMAMETEELIRAQPMDAVVLVGGCDKTVPAQLMAAASANVPAVSLVVGPMITTTHKGERLGACTDCRRAWALYRAGRINEQELSALSDRLAPASGTCMVMGTASTMALVAEALGMSLPGTAAIPSVHADRERAAERTGVTAVSLARSGTKPSRIMTREAFRNALRTIMAVAGSTNALIHLAAIAGRLGIRLSLDDVDEIGRETPVLANVKPSGQLYMEHFHEAGGLPRLMKELGTLFDTSCPTVTGRTHGENLEAFDLDFPNAAIRPLTQPLFDQGAIAVLNGNLGRAVIKQSAATASLLHHEGPAVVFDNLQDLHQRIDDPDLDVEPHSVLVLRNAGPLGAPGMPEAGYIPIPKKLSRQGVTDMVRLSDARMSGTAEGTVILHVCPEAAAGGALRLVRNGDLITLDVQARLLRLEVSDSELKRRAQAMPATPATADREAPSGYRQLYLSSVEQADRGADFNFLSHL